MRRSGRAVSFNDVTKIRGETEQPLESINEMRRTRISYGGSPVASDVKTLLRPDDFEAEAYIWVSECQAYFLDILETECY